MSSDRHDEAFLSRWSRQKRAQPQAVDSDAAVTAKEPPFDATTLPNIDDLTAESDIAAFMQKGVPEALQRLALRRMWSLEPRIRDFVEVAENQWDFNAPGGVYGLFQELEPGTDLSVWLAQATTSILPPETATEPASENGKTEISKTTVSASQQRISATETIAKPTGANVKSDASEYSEPNLVEPEVLAQSDDSDRKKRRRHGGALPV